MKKSAFILLALLFGCHHDNDSSEDSTENLVLPLEGAIYEPYQQSMGSTYTKLFLENSGDISVNIYNFDTDSVVFSATDDSLEDGGKLYVEMTSEGWGYSTTETQRKYVLNEKSELIRNGAFVKSACVNVIEDSISGMSIVDGLGDNYSWAASYTFSEGAKKYTCDTIFPDTTRVIEPIYCGPDCWGVLSLGGGELSEWIDSYKSQESPNISSGFYWLGMSMFFTDTGQIEIYSFFDHSRGILSNAGAWQIVSENGEEILEVDIPLEIKREFGVREEASPIITKVMGTRFKGVKYEATYSRPEFTINKRYFLNYEAMEDVKSAYISSLN